MTADQIVNTFAKHNSPKFKEELRKQIEEVRLTDLRKLGGLHRNSDYRKGVHLLWRGKDFKVDEVGALIEL